MCPGRTTCPQCVKAGPLALTHMCEHRRPTLLHVCVCVCPCSFPSSPSFQVRVCVCVAESERRSLCAPPAAVRFRFRFVCVCVLVFFAFARRLLLVFFAFARRVLQAHRRQYDSVSGLCACVFLCFLPVSSRVPLFFPLLPVVSGLCVCVCSRE